MFKKNLFNNIINTIYIYIYIYISKYKKYYLIYAFAVLLSAFSLITAETIAHPKMELIFLLLILFMGFFCLTFYFSHNDDDNLYKSLFVILIIFGMVCAFITPICQVGDTQEHFARAEITSRGIIFPEYNGQNFTNYYINNNSEYVWDGTGFEVIQSEKFFEDNRYKTVFDTNHDTDKINYTLVNTSQAFQQNPFFGYLPQALGISIAKLLDLNQIWMFWLGNICNLLFYCGVVTYAVKKSPIMKVPLIVTACIPLCLFQGSSVSIDAIIYALSILIIVYFFNMYKSKEKSITYKHVGIFLALCLIVGLCKLTLLAFSLLLFAVPFENFKDRKVILLSVIGIIILGFIGLLYGHNAQETLWHSKRAEQFLGKNVNATQQIQHLLTGHNLTTQSAFFFYDIGHVFNALYPGWPQMKFNTMNFLIIPAHFIIGFVYLGYPIKERFNNKSKLIAFAVLFIIFYGTYLVQYLTWTPVGYLELDSAVNTRYFLPIFALCPFVFNLNMNKEDDRIKNYTILFSLILLSGLLLCIIFQFY